MVSSRLSLSLSVPELTPAPHRARISLSPGYGFSKQPVSSPAALVRRAPGLLRGEILGAGSPLRWAARC